MPSNTTSSVFGNKMPNSLRELVLLNINLLNIEHHSSRKRNYILFGSGC